MSNLGLCLSGGVYADTYWLNLAGEPDFPTIIRTGNLRHIRLIGAGQANEALTRAGHIRTNTVVHWRHMLHTPPGGSRSTDDGMWRLPPEEWRKNVYMPNHTKLPMAYPHVRLPHTPHVSTNNEFSTASLPVLLEYIAFETERARDAAAYGMCLDMLSFPTHYPTFHGEADSPVRGWLDAGHFDPLLSAIGKAQGPVNNPRIWCVPNAYVHPDNLDGLRNIVAIHRRFVKVNGFPPHMVIGEYGYATFDGQRFDPHGGHRKDDAITAEASLDFLLHWYNVKLRPHGIGAMVYTAGLHGGEEVTSFHYTMRELQYFAQQVREDDQRPAPPVIQPPPIDGPPVDDEDTVELDPVDRLSALQKQLRQIELEIAQHHAVNRELDALERWILDKRDQQNIKAQQLQVLLTDTTNKIEELQEAAEAA